MVLAAPVIAALLVAVVGTAAAAHHPTPIALPKPGASHMRIGMQPIADPVISFLSQKGKAASLVTGERAPFDGVLLDHGQALKFALAEASPPAKAPPAWHAWAAAAVGAVAGAVLAVGARYYLPRR